MDGTIPTPWDLSSAGGGAVVVIRGLDAFFMVWDVEE
jgi:hypothetical protein